VVKFGLTNSKEYVPQKHKLPGNNRLDFLVRSIADGQAASAIHVHYQQRGDYHHGVYWHECGHGNSCGHQWLSGGEYC
jgi:hypothetical protein